MLHPVRHFALPLLIAAQVAWFPWATAQAQPAVTEGRGVPDFASALAREASVVVSITTTRRAAQGELGFAPDSFAVAAQRPTASRDPWGGPRRAEQERNLASGIVIGSDGEILTNAHAVADVERAIVRLADGRQFTGKVIGIDKTTNATLQATGVRARSCSTSSRSSHRASSCRPPALRRATSRSSS